MPVISMISPWIHPKTGVLWFRAKVPKDLRVVAGRREVKWTLGTKDKAIAAKRWPVDLQKWEAMKAGWRRELDKVSLTPDRAREIAAGWSAWIASGAALAWAEVATVGPRTKEETRGVLRSLGGFLGHDDGARVTRDDLVRWRQAEKARGDAPILAINPRRTRSERDEQKGLVNLVLGCYGMFRNPTSHEARIHWPLSLQDAEDLMSMVSLIHRRLDGAQYTQTVAPTP